MNETDPVTVGKITASKDVARRHVRQKAWGVHDLAAILSGDDPIGALRNLFGDYRARRLQAQLVASCIGVFDAASMSDAVLSLHQTSGSATSAHFLTGASFIDGAQLLGDAKDKLTGVLMHSATQASLLKQDLIDFLPDSEGKATLPTFQGKRVIFDDGVPVRTVDGKQVYTTYLFGQGAFALGWLSKNEQPVGGSGTWQLELAREALMSRSVLINRWSNILHPRGVKFMDTNVADEFPENEELEDGTNWQRVYEQKNVRIVMMEHNIAA